MRMQRVMVAIGLAVVAMAVVVPAASARPVRESEFPGPGNFDPAATPVVYEPAPDSAASGFDWGDAGIGALAALAVVAIGVGLVLAIGHRRTDGAGTATA